MSPRARVGLVVAAVAAAAAGATVGVTALTSDRPPKAAQAEPRPGSPPLLLDLGVRVDEEAVALRRAAQVYARGRRSAAAAIFGRYASVQAQIGSAFSAWPDDSLRAVFGLARGSPRSAVAQLHLGLALYWAGRRSEAVASWRDAATVQPDSASAVSAGDLLHPEIAPGLPVFVVGFPSPPELRRLSPPEQFAFLERRARRGGARAKLLYGVALQRLGRPLSAERQFKAAAGLAPNDPEALAAAAVGRFTKDDPARAFSRLGPLSARFPQAATVRFHLGLLLLWTRRLEPARRQLRLAVRADPGGLLGREAKRLLQRLESIRTR